MSSAILDVFAGLYGPFVDLAERIHNFRQKRKRAREAEDQLVNALDAEIKSYQTLSDHFAQLCNAKLVPALLQVGDDPAPLQILKVLDSFSDLPTIYVESVKCFIELARACNEVSTQEAFMHSLREGSNFLCDFVGTMSDAYVAKNTVRIDGRFFRFFSSYKNDILKTYERAYGSSKLSKEDKAQIALLEKRAMILIRNVDDHFMNRYLRSPTIRRWRSSIVRLGKVAQAVTVDKPSNFSMDIFIPPQIRPFTRFLDDLGC
jgi:hypothetical protein